jgi:hypothetical protein
MRRSIKNLANLGWALPLLLCAPAALAQAQADAPPAANPAPPEAAPADDPALAGEEDPARPPSAGKGVVWGVVTDAKTKEPVLDAQVSVVGTNKKAIADLDGRFRLELSPGNYELRVFYQGYKAQRLQNVRVTAGKVDKVDVVLPLDEATPEIVVEVEADPDRASAASQTLIRKNAPQVGDALSAQEIARTPDRNAADAARRVVGATVVDGKYVVVRGLGERYTNALLNGVPLPSPEPDRQAVPFDLFPTTVLSDITILKTFTPDMPGDFTGGSVRVTTRDLPEKFTVQGTFFIGLNSQSTFAQRLTYRGSSLDWLGIDGGTRALPGDFPDYKLQLGLPKGEGSSERISKKELTHYGQELNAYMTTQRTTALPNMSGNVTVGQTIKLGPDDEIGYIAALTYNRRFTIRSGEIIRTFTTDEQSATKPLTLRNDYRAETGLDQVSWGAFAGLTYRHGKDHKISLLGLHSRAADNEAREISGFNEEAGNTVYDTRLRFYSRALTFGQMVGEHKLRKLRDATLDWQLNLSQATSDEPDTRENVYAHDPAGRVWAQGTLSGYHFFADQKETAYGGAVNWTQPIVRGDAPTRIKGGLLLQFRSRDFNARRFRYIPRGNDPDVFLLPPDRLFTDDHIGTALELFEFTRANDAYTASQSLAAGYLMSDTSPLPWLRLIMGARVEAFHQALDSFDPYAADVSKVHIPLDKVDVLPSLGMVFKTTSKSNLRMSVSRTVARPQLRELAPFTYTDYFGAREVQGNPALERTSIVNADLRFEFFPTLSEVAAISVFYKDFDKPIEQMIYGSSRGIVSFQNAKGARNAGIELELRKNLGFASPLLADVGLLGNLTLVQSRVSLDAAQGGAQTNFVRPLAGQSPFAVNAGADYTNDKSGTRVRVLYNVFGPRIAQVGASGLPDVYEQPRHQLDITAAQRIGKHVDLKIAAQNLLLAPVKFTQGPSTKAVANDTIKDLTNVVNQYQPGTTVTLSVTVQN